MAQRDATSPAAPGDANDLALLRLVEAAALGDELKAFGVAELGAFAPQRLLLFVAAAPLMSETPAGHHFVFEKAAILCVFLI